MEGWDGDKSEKLKWKADFASFDSRWNAEEPVQWSLVGHGNVAVQGEKLVSSPNGNKWRIKRWNLK